MSFQGMSELSRRGLLGQQKIVDLEFCEDCVYGKAKRVRFASGIHTTRGPLDYVHSDLWRPARVASKGGANYMLTIIDDFSRKVWCFFLKHKGDVFSTFRDWKVQVEKQSGLVVKYLRTDNGLEFCSEEFNAYCRKEGITRHRTIVYTPQQNGVAERMNRTIMEKVRCMLSNSKLPKSFWAEAASTACYVINRSLSRAIEKKTPYELWSGKPADYTHLKPFGCPAYARVDNGKIEPRELKCVFLGYNPGVKGYKLWSNDLNKIIISRDVTFDESAMIHQTSDSTEDTIASSKANEEKAQMEVEFPTSPVTIPSPVEQQESSSPNEPVVVEETTTSQPQATTRSIARDRPRRQIVPPKRYAEAELVAYAFIVANDIESETEPLNYDEAIKSKDSSDWMIAMHNEMESLQRNGTWDLVPIPNGKRPVKCKWVYKLKEPVNPNEKPRYKARLVAKGYSQIPGVDYTDIYSPVVKHTSIRALLGLVASNDYELEQLDVTTAFLNGELEEEIFMQQPEGFVVPGKEDYVCKLKKSLYGLKQSPRQWYKRFDSFMTSHKFSKCTYDSCVYFKKGDDGSKIYLLLYVDDMLIAAKDMKEIQKLKDQLKADFEMKDLGATKKILGMEIVRDRKSRILHLSQKGYIEKVLRRFNMHKAKPVNTPFAAHFKLSSALSPTTETYMEYMARVPYSSAVGSLMYAMICTRPDLAYAVSMVSRYMANPGREHWKAVQWILRYLRGTSSMCLRYGQSNTGVVGYVDSDFGKDLDKRRSITGYAFTLNGCAISWKAQLQSTVALSSTEAEYMAITEAVKEDIWLKGMFRELDDRIKVTTVFCDNQSAIFLSEDQMFHDRTKHIDIRYHFVRDIIEKGDCVIEKIDTDYNPADVFTKSLPIAKFKLCLDLIVISDRS
ncbi:hypothetical protein L2E82_05458 [Cichorium intybus]|uniref:Uncharacterized protein n=1 Tax=Cichorium intybus TaxID=13427 RepID=A0ACB9H6W8_CICIN|nr:hypothetical protein L2E82_05458 [Cichorium intybus]